MSDQEKKPLPKFKMSMVKVIGNGTPCVMSKVGKKTLMDQIKFV